MSELIHPRHQVTFTPVLPAGQSVTALLAEVGPVMRAGAGGGWVVVDRPKRKSFLDWQGYGPYTMELSIVFDKFRTASSVEPEIETLRRMMRVPAKSTGTPPVLKVTGAAVPLSQLRWVVQNIETKEEVRNSRGARVRSFQDVTLLEYIAPDALTKPASPAAVVQEKQASKPKGSASSGTSKTYTVKSGDTLWKIAAKFLGAGQKWTEIASANGIRDPKSVEPGTTLRIP